jgi:hypothetical protein
VFNFGHLKGLIIIIGEKVGGDFWFSCVLPWTENRIFVPVVNHTAVPFFFDYQTCSSYNLYQNLLDVDQKRCVNSTSGCVPGTFKVEVKPTTRCPTPFTSSNRI